MLQRAAIPVVLLAASALSGCAFGGCGFVPTDVTWHEPGLLEALGRLDDSWTVTTEAPGGGLELDAPAVREHLGASALKSLSWRPPGFDHEQGLAEAPYLFHGTPDLDALRPDDPDHEQGGNQSSGGESLTQALMIVRDGTSQATLEAVARAFMANVTTAAGDDLDFGVQAWVGSGQARGYTFEGDRRVDLIEYRVLVQAELRLDALFAELQPQPRGNQSNVYEADGWTFRFQPVTRAAESGGDRFWVDTLGNARYERDWGGDVGEEEALEDFRAAYARLGRGEAPADASLGGMTC